MTNPKNNSLINQYEIICSKNNWEKNQEQQKLLTQLQEIKNLLETNIIKKNISNYIDIIYKSIKKYLKKYSNKNYITSNNALYIYGDVGRGKTFLMDIFFESLTIKEKSRLHFCQFINEIHLNLHKLRQKKSMKKNYAIKILVIEMLKNTKCLCLDEFYISNIADAMIINEVFNSILQQNIALIITSNRSPQELYLGGVEKKKIQTLIQKINSSMKIIHLQHSQDYRLTPNTNIKEIYQNNVKYIYPINPQNIKLFFDSFLQLNKSQILTEKSIILSKTRKFHIKYHTNNIVFLDFVQLCGPNLSIQDYQKIAEQYNIFFISKIHRLNQNNINLLQKLINLIDILYDQKKIVYFLAETPFNYIYDDSVLSFEFNRTISRVTELIKNKKSSQ